MLTREERRQAGYKNLFPESRVCIYCGLPAEVFDHVLPYSHRNNPLAANRILAPSCKECNLILSNSLQITIGDRIAEAKRRLRKRYKKLLSAPNWKLEELFEMSPEFQVRILQMESRKKIIEDRITFDYFLWEKLGFPNDLLPRIR